MTSTERGATSIARPCREIGDELFAAADVEARSRLVEQHDARLVHQRAREQDTLTLTGRQRRELVLRQLLAAPVAQQLEGTRPIGVRVPVPPRCERGVARSHHDLRSRHRWFELRREQRATRRRSVPAASARRYARAARRAPRRFPTMGADTAPRSAAASSSRRRSTRARPTVRSRAPPTRRDRGCARRRGSVRRCRSANRPARGSC